VQLKIFLIDFLRRMILNRYLFYRQWFSSWL